MGSFVAARFRHDAESAVHVTALLNGDEGGDLRSGIRGVLEHVTLADAAPFEREQVTTRAVVDMDQAVRDPAAPAHLLPAYDSGDHRHPNAAGAAAMGATVVRALQLVQVPMTRSRWLTLDW